MPQLKRTIVSYLASYAASAPDKKIFVVFEDSPEEISAFELLQSVQATAWLLHKDIFKGQPVILMYQDVLEFVIAFLACQYVGAIPVPVPYLRGSKQLERLFAILYDVQGKTILCTSDTANLVADTFTDIQVIITNEQRAQFTVIDPVEHPTAFIQYTSGSTSRPKGVVVSMDSLLHNQKLIQSTFQTSSAAVICSWLPFHHDMGLVGNILHTIYAGCSCVLMSPFHFMQRPLRWLVAITTYKVSHSGGPNFAYDLCSERISPQETAHLDLSSWEVAYNGSEPVRADTMLRFAALFSKAGFNEMAFSPCYGLAEATLLVSGVKRSDRYIVMGTTVSAGAAPEHVKTLDKTGEIVIGGPSVTSGYYNKDNSDLFVTIDGHSYLRTGDAGFIHEGELFISGRLKEMMIIRGRNIYPYDMEHQVAAISTAIVPNGVAVFCIAEDQYVVMAETKRFATVDEELVSRQIALELTGSYGVSPYDICLVRTGALPRTTSGKIQRTKLAALHKEGAHPGGNAVSIDPVLRDHVHLLRDYTAIKKYLVNRISHKVGKAPSYDDHEPLTALGVDSLRLMELLNLINSELEIHVTIADVLKRSTVYGLIQLIEDSLWLDNRPPSGNEIII